MVSSHRRRELFGDCALVEIIHLHDCLRGALKALEADVNELSRSIDHGNSSNSNNDIRHQEPPAPLEQEQHLQVQRNPPGGDPAGAAGGGDNDPTVLELERRVASRFKVIWSVFRSHSAAEDEFIWPALSKKTAGRIGGASGAHSPGSPVVESHVGGAAEAFAAPAPAAGAASVEVQEDVIVQEEYEEDHADEERMFAETDARRR
jgi:hypothetical protein